MSVVSVVEHIPGNKWKAEWIDPNPGLVHYIESGQLICLWKEHKAFLKEESEAQCLREHNEHHGYIPESPLTKAVEQVFETVGDEIQFYRGVLSGSPDALERVKQRAGMPGAPNSPLAYTHRQGTIHFPFNYALELARKFCTAEPSTVLVGVETTERARGEQGYSAEGLCRLAQNCLAGFWARSAHSGTMVGPALQAFEEGSHRDVRPRTNTCKVIPTASGSADPILYRLSAGCVTEPGKTERWKLWFLHVRESCPARDLSLKSPSYRPSG